LPFVPIDQAIKVKKEKTTEDLARAVEGRRRGILMQLKLSIEAVHKSEDSHQAATELLDKKRAALANLKSKAKEKAENELEILIQALAKYT
jgi:tryptophanyl-tRNA synthetase